MDATDTVTLTPYEMRMAVFVGVGRHFSALVKGSRPRFPEREPGELWNHHIHGACAELAVAKRLRLYWDGSVDTYGGEDIPGTGADVRYGKPKIKPGDTGRIVAVVPGGGPFQFRIWGWMEAAAGRRPEWAAPTPPPCWFPPAWAWNPIGTLLAEARV